jgi:hypothetical protein
MQECKLSQRYLKRTITAIGFNSEEQFNDVIIYWFLDCDTTWFGSLLQWGMPQRTMLQRKNATTNSFYQ